MGKMGWIYPAPYGILPLGQCSHIQSPSMLGSHCKVNVDLPHRQGHIQLQPWIEVPLDIIEGRFTPPRWRGRVGGFILLWQRPSPKVNQMRLDLNDRGCLRRTGMINIRWGLHLLHRWVLKSLKTLPHLWTPILYNKKIPLAEDLIRS